MSNITSTQTPLWKHGTRGNNIEFAAIKLLEKQEPSTYKLIEWKEGFTVNDANYQYFVGKSQYGFWLSRKKLPVFIPDTQAPLTINVATSIAAEPKKIAIPDMNMKQLDNIEEVSRMEDSLSFSPNEIKILKELASAINVLIKARQ
jgi:hypothetical protein